MLCLHLGGTQHFDLLICVREQFCSRLRQDSTSVSELPVRFLADEGYGSTSVQFHLKVDTIDHELFMNMYIVGHA